MLQRDVVRLLCVSSAQVPRASHDAKPSPKLVATSQPQDYRHKQGVTEIGTVHMQDIWA